MIGKLSRSKAGFTRGWVHPLDEQLGSDSETGGALKWKVQPYNEVDEIAAYHDKVILINKWLNHWIRFLMVKCQNGVKQHDF